MIILARLHTSPIIIPCYAVYIASTSRRLKYAINSFCRPDGYQIPVFVPLLHKTYDFGYTAESLSEATATQELLTKALKARSLSIPVELRAALFDVHLAPESLSARMLVHHVENSWQSKMVFLAPDAWALS